ncbi:hypothetical protein EXIGLDRAFT_79523 [Exidia glandulosa HHB12029]|uniref:Uncharacterized protein n=1 Tax=Exidia glandulosa HHB12029 TaxID=1314781 RepID=A0A166MHI4_EXIGL|nr:hypothetical protein EXIGLDRAFT_79523 [Exidia glandulosa HHB12029]
MRPTGSTDSARRAGRLRVAVFVLLLVINALWASFLIVALSDSSLNTSRSYHNFLIFMLVTAFGAVLLLSTIALIDFVTRERDPTSTRSRAHKVAECISLAFLTLAQYAAATTFAVLASANTCPITHGETDGCRFLDAGIRAGSWTTPTLLLLYVLYVIIHALMHSGTSSSLSRPDLEAPRVTVQTTQHAPTFTLSFFDAAAERGKDSSSHGHGHALKPPAPAYAYAAAGAIRRLSQTMWQGVRRPGTPVR